MFRLAKILNTSNASEETVFLTKKSSDPYPMGCALVCTNGSISYAAADSYPDYIVTNDVNSLSRGKIQCFQVTENMVFKVEYTSAIAAKLGMRVGITSSSGSPSTVTFNLNGKGLIVALDENPNIVYVKFYRT